MKRQKVEVGKPCIGARPESFSIYLSCLLQVSVLSPVKVSSLSAQMGTNVSETGAWSCCREMVRQQLLAKVPLDRGSQGLPSAQPYGPWKDQATQQQLRKWLMNILNELIISVLYIKYKYMCFYYCIVYLNLDIFGGSSPTQILVSFTYDIFLQHVFRL